MALQKKDFIEIEFTGKIPDGEVFDSNIKKDIENAELKTQAKPFIFSLGQGMFLKGVDDFLIGKEVGKTYEIKLKAKDAFGLRDPNLVKVMPMTLFKQHKLNPFPGAVFNFDGRLAKVLSVSGGRVRVDFNNLLAGKDVEYKVKVLRKIDNIDEKAKAFIQFLFRKDFKFQIKDKKITIGVEKPLVKFVEMFKDKFKEVLDLDLQVKGSAVKETTKLPENNAKPKDSGAEPKE
jgi:FKBP-type peptidyl-prolyl cis-trans isomerase 2